MFVVDNAAKPLRHNASHQMSFCRGLSLHCLHVCGKHNRHSNSWPSRQVLQKTCLVQGSGDKLSRPYRISPDQNMSVGRSAAAGLVASKAASDRLTSSGGASTSGTAFGSKVGGLPSNMSGSASGKSSITSRR